MLSGRKWADLRYSLLRYELSGGPGMNSVSSTFLSPSFSLGPSLARVVHVIAHSKLRKIYSNPSISTGQVRSLIELNQT